MVYHMAGIKNPIEDLDLIETHDAFTISDLQTYGDVGLTLYGREQDYVTSGDCYLINPHTGKAGKCPANISGGLLGTMHAVGATGLMQICECALHLWKKHADVHGSEARWRSCGKKKPRNWQDLTVKGAKRALAISHAGVGSHVTATVLQRPEASLKGGK